jgi:hypothetical protein
VILYHYCSNKNLLAILESHELWASELSMSNDRMEGRWIRTIFADLCNKKQINAHQQNQLLAHLDNLIAFFGATGFCLSEYGDVLSQWRGYADDGAGVSVGFSKDYLDGLNGAFQDKEYGVVLHKVEYERDQQEKQLAPQFDNVMGWVEKGALRSTVGSLLYQPSETEKKKIEDAFRHLTFEFLAMFPLLYTLKNPAFSEEHEWRLLSYVTRMPNRIEDGDLPKLNFIAKSDRIVPVRRIPIEVDASPIAEVILGPRNVTPDNVISAALAKYGFKSVKVGRSTATYNSRAD